MNDYDQAVAHSGNSINIARSINSDNVGIRHGQAEKMERFGVFTGAEFKRRTHGVNLGGLLSAKGWLRS
jgi:hypothetical protein